MLNSSPKDIRGATPPGSDPGPRHVDFGLVIGVDHYADDAALRGAIQDAEQFHEWLCLENGGGVAADHARLIRSTHGAGTITDDEHAQLKREVDTNLKQLLQAADAQQGGRRLYFHFSGHGRGDTAESHALLLATWSAMLAQALGSWKYRRYLEERGLFEELVVLLDCCRSDGRANVYPPEIEDFRQRTEHIKTRVFVAYATRPGGWSFESTEDGRWQGVFTRRLLQILRSAERGISAADLKRDLEHPEMHSGQQAHVENGLTATSRFGRRGTRSRLVVSFTRSRGHIVLRGGDLGIVVEHDVTTHPDGTLAPWELTVARGLYKLEDDSGAELLFQHDGEAVKHVSF